MSKSVNIQGTWRPDYKAWAKLDPEVAEQPATFEFMLGRLEVVITADKLVISNFGRPGNQNEYNLVLKEGSDTKITFEVSQAGSTQVEEFVVEISDHNRIILWTSPEPTDAFALKRAH